MGNLQRSMSIGLVFDYGKKSKARWLGLVDNLEISLELAQIDFDPCCSWWSAGVEVISVFVGAQARRVAASPILEGRSLGIKDIQ